MFVKESQMFIHNQMERNYYKQQDAIKQRVTEIGVDTAVEITKILNEEILKGGEIQEDNSAIWDGWLHKKDNEDWQAMLIAMRELMREYPRFFKQKDMDILDTVWTTLQSKGNVERVLDTKKYKGTAWGAIHTVREVVCRCWDLYLPNNDGSKRQKVDDFFEFN